MSRSSPGVRRVAAILNFIADHPGQAFALTDLVRALKLSRATCHALLTGLVDVGYLYRTSDKTYVLGPALAAIGNSALQHFSPLQVAHPEMRKLADEFDVLCGAYFLEDSVVRLRDRASSASHVGSPIPLGARFTLHESMAPIFFSDPATGFDSWVRTTGITPTEVQKAQFEAGAQFVREHGFIVIERKYEYSPPDMAFDQEAATTMTDLPIRVITDLDDDRSHSIAAIMSAIHDERGRVGFALGMTGFYTAMPAQRVAFVGQRIREACERISSFVARRQVEAA